MAQEKCELDSGKQAIHEAHQLEHIYLKMEMIEDVKPDLNMEIIEDIKPDLKMEIIEDVKPDLASVNSSQPPSKRPRRTPTFHVSTEQEASTRGLQRPILPYYTESDLDDSDKYQDYVPHHLEQSSDNSNGLPDSDFARTLFNSQKKNACNTIIPVSTEDRDVDLDVEEDVSSSDEDFPSDGPSTSKPKCRRGGSGGGSGRGRGQGRGNRQCVTSPATTTAESAIPPKEEEEEPPLVTPDASHSPGQSPHEEEEEQQQPAPKKKGKGKKKADGAPKQGWSLPDLTEQELVEWLQANTYLWLRSTKDYHRKKAAWEMKAKELGVSLKHLQNWWKNVKDWYVKLSKRTSGQATKLLTARDKWVLKNIAFYKSSMPTDVPDTLVSLPRSPSSTDPTSQAQESHDSGDANILEDMEVAGAEQASTSSRKRRTAGYESQEEGWMLDLRSTMKANQALLERLLQERPQPQTPREAFIRYVSDILRTVPDEEYQVLHDIIADTLRQRHMGPSTSGAGPGSL